MRCVLCDRCKKIVEDERKIKAVTYARPLNVCPNAKTPPRADDRQVSDLVWTKELCPACAEEFETFMESAGLAADTPAGDSSGVAAGGERTPAL